MTGAMLATIHFGEDQDIDRLLEAFVSTKLASGLRICGVLQSRSGAKGECYCSDMDLKAIGTGKVFRISQSLGSGSSGCRLHPGAMAECSAYLDQQIQEGCDLLVLNRFGKGESQGQGFRELISTALMAGIPVLTATRENYRKDWQIFAGELGVELPFEQSAVSLWFVGLEHEDAASTFTPQKNLSINSANL